MKTDIRLLRNSYAYVRDERHEALVDRLLVMWDAEKKR